MEIFISILGIAFLVAVAVNFWLFSKIASLNKKFKSLKSKIDDIDDGVKYIKGIELDFSSLEEKFKDEMEQFENQTDDNFTEMGILIERQEEEIEELKSKVEELEKLKEEIDDDIDAKIEEKMEELDLSNNNVEDSHYEEARELAMKSDKVSSSLLQRKLRIGYSRAASLIDMLEDNGVIGKADGAKPRKVLVKK